jgi:dTMP kinase
MQGKLIVIDGIDGAGKATQTKLLIARLEKSGYKTATLDFPQYYNNFFGKLTGRFLNGEFGDAPTTNPYIASILYAADRWESKKKIEAWLSEGKVVILDRYVSSNQIHQGGKISDAEQKKKFLDYLEEMEFKVFKIPKPDSIIFLNVPYDISKKLVVKKNERAYANGAKQDQVEKSKTYQEASYRQSLELVKKYNNWIEINCVEGDVMLPPEAISEKVWQALEKEIAVA